jgi:hypothetical protein
MDELLAWLDDNGIEEESKTNVQRSQQILEAWDFRRTATL